MSKWLSASFKDDAFLSSWHKKGWRCLMCLKLCALVWHTFTRQMRDCEHEKVKNVGNKSENQLHLSSTVPQHVRHVIVATQTWVCQPIFANFLSRCQKERLSETLSFHGTRLRPFPKVKISGEMQKYRREQAFEHALVAFYFLNERITLRQGSWKIQLMKGFHENYFGGTFFFQLDFTRNVSGDSFAWQLRPPTASHSWNSSIFFL